MTDHVSHKEIQFAQLTALTWRNEQRIRLRETCKDMEISINTIDIYSFASVPYGHFRQLHIHISNGCQQLNENRIVQRNTVGEP